MAMANSNIDKWPRPLVAVVFALSSYFIVQLVFAFLLLSYAGHDDDDDDDV